MKSIAVMPVMFGVLLGGALGCMASTQSLVLTSPPGAHGLNSQELERREVLTRIKKAHIVSDVRPDAFDSYRLSGCIYLEPSALPKSAATTKLGCVKEETGVLKPSFAYIRIVVGATQLTELVDLNQGKGWQIKSGLESGRSAKSLRSVSALQKPKYDAIAETAQYSLLALLAILNDTTFQANSNFTLSSREKFLVIEWRAGNSLNEFFFNKETLLCEKQRRTVEGGASIFKYSGYRNVSNVLLPHTIVFAKDDGTPVARREIEKWDLGRTWPPDYFNPNKIQALPD